MTSSLRVTALALAAGMGLGASGTLADGYFGGSIKDTPVVSVDSWSGLYIGAAVGYGVATTDVDVSKQWKKHGGGWGDPISILDLDGLSSEARLGL